MKLSGLASGDEEERERKRKNRERERERREGLLKGGETEYGTNQRY